MPTSTLVIRHACSSDVGLIFSLLQKKAEFDRQIGSFSGALGATEEKLNRTLFNEPPFAKVLLAEVEGEAVAIALYYFRYSSFMAQPSLWLDDLYVVESNRSQRIGTALMAEMAKLTKAQNCTHMAWTAWEDNVRGLSFYQKIGATQVAVTGKLLFLKLGTPDIERLSQLSSVKESRC